MLLSNGDCNLISVAPAYGSVVRDEVQKQDRLVIAVMNVKVFQEARY
jgi:hypothetical protein